MYLYAAIRNRMEKKKNNHLDLVIIACMIAIGLFAMTIVLFVQKDGEMVTVEVSGREVASFPLSEDVTYVIDGKNGGTNTLMIKDGYAWVEEASCPDGLCRNMGKIHNSSQSIICLPNEVVIRITGGEDSEIDAVIH